MAVKKITTTQFEALRSELLKSVKAKISLRGHTDATFIWQVESALRWPIGTLLQKNAFDLARCRPHLDRLVDEQIAKTQAGNATAARITLLRDALKKELAGIELRITDLDFFARVEVGKFQDDASALAAAPAYALEILSAEMDEELVASILHERRMHQTNPELF